MDTPTPAAHTPRRRVGVYGHLHQDGLRSRIGRLLERMASDGILPVVYAPFARYLESGGVALPQCCERTADDGPDVESVVSIGGDGTFLQASRWLAGREAAILGVNTGHLGYLASFSLDHIGRICEALRGHRCRRERRQALQLSCEGLPEDFWPYALNDVAVLKADTALMIWVQARLDGSYLADFQGDGLILSTPTGSTGYNLSVGGPILEPSLPCMVISPVATHSLTVRPLVVSAESEVELVVSGRSDTFRVSVDGRSFRLPCGTPLRIRRAPHEVVLLVPDTEDFAATLRSKLLWGRR